MTPIENHLTRAMPRRKPEGIVAALLPFDATGNIAEEAFAERLKATHTAGLTSAVNMDTGYANYLDDVDKERILRLTRATLGNAPFVAGAYIEGKDGDIVDLYQREIAKIREFGGTPILFQTARMHDRTPAEKAGIYRAACEGLDSALAFELGRMFAHNGEIFDADTAERLMEIPALKGMKHSSLDVGLELTRLELRDKVRPDFKIYTGNDLGIRMTEFGSDYLLGLATFCPEKFTERDALWSAGDPAYYALSEAIQYLGAVAFRAPVPAYKHSAAIFLHLTGKIPTDKTHPRNPLRPQWEREILTDCAHRLNLPIVEGM
jgi:4-hydroxy-tetrahydrodipicolinate synthase